LLRRDVDGVELAPGHGIAVTDRLQLDLHRPQRAIRFEHRAAAAAHVARERRFQMRREDRAGHRSEAFDDGSSDCFIGAQEHPSRHCRARRLATTALVDERHRSR
jgi:hypothetical protein